MSDWAATRARVLDMVRAQAPIDAALCRGNAWLTPAEQLAVYAEQYVLRMRDALREDLLGTCHLLGDEADDVLAAFVDAYPPRTWTLATIAQPFADWAIHRGLSDAVVDMARLDQAVQHAFTAGSGTVPRPDQLDQALTLAPHLRLLRVRHNVHLVRADLSNEDPPRPLRTTDFCLLVYRSPERVVRHAEVHPVLFEILEAMGSGATLAEAIDGCQADDALLGEHLQPWFSWLAARSLLTLRDPTSAT
jgi:hypothetical protein